MIKERMKDQEGGRVFLTLFPLTACKKGKNSKALERDINFTLLLSFSYYNYLMTKIVFTINYPLYVVRESPNPVDPAGGG